MHTQNYIEISYPSFYVISTSCDAATALVSVSTLPSSIKTSNSLSNSSAVLAFGRVGRPPLDLGGAGPLAGRGALGRIGPLHGRYFSKLVYNATAVRTLSAVSSHQHPPNAPQAKVVRSCLARRPLTCQADLQIEHVGVGQCQTRFPSVVLRNTQRLAQCNCLEYKPFASLPSNSFLARDASAGFSYVTMATPDERPLRSYFKSKKVIS